MSLFFIKRIFICIVIFILLFLYVHPAVGKYSTSCQLNENSYADNLRVKVKTNIIDILLRANVFNTHIWNENNCTIDFYLDIKVTSKLTGRIVFDIDYGLIKDVKPGYHCNVGYLDYRDFKAKRFLFGIFDINIEIKVVQDDSVKTYTAHGIIFNIATIVWNFTLLK